ncbi:FIST signal transduction protein [Thiohalobacter thiocyanaticus]|uniref:Histidine kinase n=1 Tax=Thiohalobacter thiocyanaticus TaxID=585455 RepID=A0A426QIV1_9GAMM|nr:FIST N-terminal domain-containing protein [Thiohalobacter thiocyanaticus]RRQ21675.1 histidine kinase [Thiohalobacter thiocyanaticus]
MKGQPHKQADTEIFRYGHSAGADWEQAAEQCLRQIGYIPPETNLGFLYVTDEHAAILPSILEHFREQTGINDWVGTVGMGICATGIEYYETPAMAVMVGAFGPEDYRILPTLQSLEMNELDALDDWLAGSAAHLGIVHGDPRNAAGPELIERLAARLPGGFLVGGLSSSRDQEPQIANRIVQGGLSGVVFSDRVQVVTGLSQGCTPIAGKHEITECERNVISRIDERPALDVFYEDIGEILARDLNRVAGYIFAGLPLQGSDTADYLVRNLVGVDTRNKLLAVGDLLQPGQEIQFCRRDGASAWEDLERMLGDLKARTGDRPIRGGVYYSCLGRGKNLFGEESDELRAIRERLGGFPLVGFFANGEIFHNRLYGYTGVLTLFL